MQNIFRKIRKPDWERFLDTSQLLMLSWSLGGVAATFLGPFTCYASATHEMTVKDLMNDIMNTLNNIEHLPALLLIFLCNTIGMYRRLSKAEEIRFDNITVITMAGLCVAGYFLFSIRDLENITVFTIFFTSLFDSYRSEEAQFTRMENEPTDAQLDEAIAEELELRQLLDSLVNQGSASDSNQQGYFARLVNVGRGPDNALPANEIR